jgi:hypothetical protein
VSSQEHERSIHPKTRYRSITFCQWCGKTQRVCVAHENDSTVLRCDVAYHADKGDNSDPSSGAYECALLLNSNRELDNQSGVCDPPRSGGFIFSVLGKLVRAVSLHPLSNHVWV